MDGKKKSMISILLENLHFQASIGIEWRREGRQGTHGYKSIKSDYEEKELACFVCS